MNVKSALLNVNRLSDSMRNGKEGIKKINHYFLENNVHKTAQMRYPVAKSIPLPRNIEGIITNEIGRFSPQRTRDLNGPVIVSQTSGKVMPLFQIERTKTCFDPRVASFDCMSAVNLNSSMQTNVPYPFSSKGKSTHLNMPGGQWESKNKFISEDMQKAHSYNMKKKKEGMRMFHTLTNNYDLSSSFFTRRASSDSKQSKKEIGEVKLTLRQKLQKAITEYGTTVIVFHVGISLVSLGTCYILVSSGIDMGQLLTPLGLGGTGDAIDTNTTNRIAAGTGTFVAAYVIHKMFAPARIAITLAATPFIVRYLRNIGFLKKPPKVQ